MKIKSNRLVYFLIIALYSFFLIISLLTGKNFINIGQVLIIIVLMVGLSYFKFSVFITIVISVLLLTPFLSQYLSIFTYMPYLMYLLILFKIIQLKLNNKIEYYPSGILTISILVLLVLSLVGLIYRLDFINPAVFFFSILKKYGFLISYILIINTPTCILDKIYKILIIYTLSQLPLIIYQYIIGTNRDHITGLFGLNGTGLALQFFMIVYVYILTQSDSKVLKNIYLIFILIFCALAEVKIGFIIVPLIYILYILLAKKSVKTILQISGLIFVFIIAYKMFITFYPKHDFLRNNSMTVDYLTSSYLGQAINRFGYWETLEYLILNNNILKIFGTGLGSANPSSIELLEGSIHQQFNYLNYSAFFIPYTLIESGILGTILNILLYVIILIKSYVYYIKYNSNYLLSNILIVCLTILLLFYNNSLSSPLILFFIWYSIAYNERKMRNNLINII